MMRENSSLRQQAVDALTGNWGKVALFSLVYFVIMIGASNVFKGALTLATLPLEFGFVLIFLRLLRGEPIEIGQIFNGYKDFGRVFGTVLLQ